MCDGEFSETEENFIYYYYNTQIAQLLGRPKLETNQQKAEVYDWFATDYSWFLDDRVKHDSFSSFVFRGNICIDDDFANDFVIGLYAIKASDGYELDSEVEIIAQLLDHLGALGIKTKKRDYYKARASSVLSRYRLQQITT
jgi:hypothetical protein